jgi:hypothetical protein
MQDINMATLPAINLTGGLPPEILGQQQQLNRQQQMAQMLMQQGQQMPQGQMISGRYVQPSIFAQLAPLAQMYAGQKMLERGDQKALDLAKQLREGQSAALADYMGQSQGRPAVPDRVTEMAGPYGVSGAGQNIPMPTAVVQGRPEIKADPLLASMNALQNPYAPEFLRQQAIKNLIPEEITMPEGSSRVVRNPDGTYRTVATGPEKTSPEYKNFLIAKNDPVNPFKGGFTDYQLSLKRAGAPSVSVSTANKFAGGFAGKASEGAYNMYESALAAPQQIENAKRTIELVNSGALTGPTADVALTAAKIFNVAGADNKDTISKTEQLFSNRGKAMLGSIKQSGLAGSQGLTEGERKFLTQAEGGTITLNAETLKAMAGLEIKLAVANQKKWNAQASKMDKEILNATGAGPVEVYTGIGTIDTSNPLLKR